MCTLTLQSNHGHIFVEVFVNVGGCKFSVFTYTLLLKVLTNLKSVGEKGQAARQLAVVPLFFMSLQLQIIHKFSLHQ